MTHVVVGSSGDPCPRCGRHTEVRQHPSVTDKQLRRPFYFRQWFYCRNRRCKTTVVVLPEYRVFNTPGLMLAST
jgi:hypothetical protein